MQLIVNYDVMLDVKEVKFVEVGKSGTGVEAENRVPRSKTRFSKKLSLIVTSRILLSNSPQRGDQSCQV